MTWTLPITPDVSHVLKSIKWGLLKMYLVLHSNFGTSCTIIWIFIWHIQLLLLSCAKCGTNQRLGFWGPLELSSSTTLNLQSRSASTGKFWFSLVFHAHRSPPCLCTLSLGSAPSKTASVLLTFFLHACTVNSKKKSYKVSIHGTCMLRFPPI